MSDNLSSKTGSVECQVKTKFVKHTYDFSWSIEDFPKYPSTFSVTSPKFHPIKGLSFYATLETSASGYKCNNLEFAFVQESEDPLEVSHSLVVTDDKGGELKKDSTTYKYKNGYRKHCLHYGYDTDFVKEPILIFKCKMEFYVSTTDIVSKHPMPIPMEKTQNLVGDLRAMCNESLHADLCLQLKETSLNVHKGILCSRSPVFAKLIGPPMDEKEKDIISVADIELRVVGGFMEFLYTGVLSNDDFDFVYDMYSAAVKYDVSSLRKTCTDVLLAKLDVENACRVLRLADRHGDVQFKDEVMNFIQFHFDDIILQPNTWSKFIDDNDDKTKLALAYEIMQCRSRKLKEISKVA